MSSWSAPGPSQPTGFDAQLDTRLAGPSRLIWTVGLALVVFLLWAGFAKVDEIVRAPAELVSASRPQIIQNLEGGILAELMVREGDEVAPGDVLARLQGTGFQTNVDDIREKITALEIRRLRLEAEMEGLSDFAVPEALAERSPEIVASERALLAARQGDYAARAEGARKVAEQAERENELMENMLAEKVVALIEVTRTRKAASDARARHDEVVSTAALRRADEYAETLKELAGLRQQMKVSADQLARTEIRSPMKGVVNKISVSTIGGVVRPGEEILQIVPLGDALFVEARVKPRDIATVRPGQPATIKLSAYDYTIYGSMKGEVSFVSADTFKDERRPEREAHYKVVLKIDESARTARQDRIEMRPGLVADVELHTGEKTVLSYLTKPLTKAGEAFHEP
ncbi:HlyD family efflux transporter periplasmic adaptor subunit [Vannielia litorea]|uniref:HlyD family efflux transporter periplasmic adaptor subunit n=1 Tax=Vannielia litorea TaxID=1217970 RepID=UPI001C95BEE8|nr:HlyD family efflux transporter periplasmic adaptor subunit [Vannielia litorea]MBY6152166.1 HlyD family efflux transporter periplasmic adaptor subunit [Vannielia litorea]